MPLALPSLTWLRAWIVPALLFLTVEQSLSGYGGGGGTTLPPPPPEITSGEWVYTETSRGVALVAYNGVTSHLVVPASIDNKPVVTCLKLRLKFKLRRLTVSEGVQFIGNEAFSEQTELTQVQLPVNTIHIGFGAFRGCSALQTIQLPRQIAAKGASADGALFEGCTSLTEIVIPSTWRNVPRRAFKGCTGLTNVTLEEGIVFIDQEAFRGCSQLNLQLPPSVRGFGAYALAGTALREVTWAADWSLLHAGVFAECPALERVHIEPREDWSAILNQPNDGSGFTKLTRLFADCPSLREVSLPEGLSQIPAGLLGGCTALESLKLPSTITRIRAYAFFGCSALESLDFPSTLTTIEAGAFEGCTGLQIAAWPAGLQSVGNRAFAGCHALDIVSLVRNGISLGTAVFAGCTQPTELILPSNLAYLGQSLEGFVGLRRLTLGAQVSSLTGMNLLGCENLEAVVIEAGNPSFKSKDGWVFSKDGRTLIFVPPGLKRTEINIPPGVWYLGRHCLANHTALQWLNLPEGLLAMEDHALLGCTSLRTLQVPASVIRIMPQVFQQCINLQELVIWGDGPLQFSGVHVTYPYIATSILVYLNLNRPLSVTLPEKLGWLPLFSAAHAGWERLFFSDLQALPVQGWRRSAWFGWFFPQLDHWVQSLEHGPLNLHAAPGGLYAYDAHLQQWLFFAESYYQAASGGWIYFVGSASWQFHQSGTRSPARWFYDPTPGQGWWQELE